MHTMSFQERASALENAFFHDVDVRLREKLRKEIATQEAKAALRAMSGISNDTLLTELVEIGVQPETLAAVTVIPLVAVAWADGKVDDAERRKILEIEHKVGILENSPCHQLLDQWQGQNPGQELLETWKHYVTALHEKLTQSGCELLGNGLMECAHEVAKSSGGYLTYGSISPSEHRVLEELKATLQSTGG